MPALTLSTIRVAFELSDRADDDDDSPAQWAGRIDRLAEADELDIRAVELIQDFEQVFGRACDAIARPDQDDIETTTASITHQITESGPLALVPEIRSVYS